MSTKFVHARDGYFLLDDAKLPACIGTIADLPVLWSSPWERPANNTVYGQLQVLDDERDCIHQVYFLDGSLIAAYNLQLGDLERELPDGSLQQSDGLPRVIGELYISQKYSDQVALHEVPSLGPRAHVDAKQLLEALARVDKTPQFPPLRNPKFSQRSRRQLLM